MAMLLDGKKVAAVLNEQLKVRAAALKAAGTPPTLAIVRVGEKGDDIAYERGALKRCGTVGVETRLCTLPADVSQEKLEDAVRAISADGTVHGCLLLRPLPKRLDDRAVRALLLPAKDVDGITDGSLAGVFTGTDTGYAPCTAEACMEILDYYGVDVTGKRAVVIGRSLVVGKPAAMMLMGRNATVTVCHTRTKDMPALCREADVLIAAAGRTGMVGAEFGKPGQIVIDVGINVDENGKLRGDADFAALEPVVGAITPVPGGVGTVTTSVLVKHVVEAAEKSTR